MGRPFGNAGSGKIAGICAVPVILIVVGVIFRFALVGYSFTSYLFFAAALCVLYFKILGLHIGSGKIRLLKRVSMIVLAIIIAFCAVTEALIIRASFGDDAADADYLIVLGAGVNGTEPSRSLLDRLEAALGYLRENENTVCIVSGGQGGGEDISEAACMEKWLTERGIEKTRVLTEDRSSSTEENIRFSLEIIGREKAENSKIAVLSSEYHLLRAKLLFKKEGIDAFGVPGRTSILPLMVNYFLREIPAVWITVIS